MNKVLIVEDDPMVALINKNYVESIDGFEAIGPVMYEEEILKALEKNKVDLILLDVFLPGKSGFELLKELRIRGYTQPVIMITAANSTMDLKNAYAYGVIDYLIKPFEFKRFEEAIKHYNNIKKIFNCNGEITQELLDIRGGIDRSVVTTLPKGLNNRTLEKIKDFLRVNNNKVWTIREISFEINISNVTIKKYMDYLESVNLVQCNSTIGQVGRPEMKYIINI